MIAAQLSPICGPASGPRRLLLSETRANRLSGAGCNLDDAFGGQQGMQANGLSRCRLSVAGDDVAHIVWQLIDTSSTRITTHSPDSGQNSSDGRWPRCHSRRAAHRNGLPADQDGVFSGNLSGICGIRCGAQGQHDEGADGADWAWCRVNLDQLRRHVGISPGNEGTSVVGQGLGKGRFGCGLSRPSVVE